MTRKKANQGPSQATGVTCNAGVKPAQGPKRIGRPPEPVPQDIADAIVEWLECGKTLTSFLAANGPSAATVTAWKQKDPEFAERFARARAAGAALMIDEGQDILDAADSETAQLAKAQAEFRAKRAACYCPALFGTKVQLGGDPTGTPIKVESGPEAPSPQDLAARMVQAVEIARSAVARVDDGETPAG